MENYVVIAELDTAFALEGTDLVSAPVSPNGMVDHDEWGSVDYTDDLTTAMWDRIRAGGQN